MDSEELLAQLADIHLPEPVSYWPPAPGWWVLAVLVLVALFYAARWLAAARTRRLLCGAALSELTGCYQALVAATESGINPQQAKLHYLNGVNSVLRRVALVHFPHSRVASLGGEAWVAFIRQSGDAGLMDAELETALSHGRFQTRCEVDADALLVLGQTWIKSLYDSAINRRPGDKAGAAGYENSDGREGRGEPMGQQPLRQQHQGQQPQQQQYQQYQGQQQKQQRQPQPKEHSPDA